MTGPYKISPAVSPAIARRTAVPAIYRIKTMLTVLLEELLSLLYIQDKNYTFCIARRTGVPAIYRIRTILTVLLEELVSLLYTG